jgi:2-haloacid dehalogenase
MDKQILHDICTSRYKPFSAVMLYSLEHALREAGLTLNQPSPDKVMAFADHHLSVFPDVLKGLAKLEKMHNTTSVIFSNETDAMVSASLRNSLSSYAHFFKHIVTVEETRRYKPAPEVYEMLARKVRKAEKVGKM